MSTTRSQDDGEDVTEMKVTNDHRYARLYAKLARKELTDMCSIAWCIAQGKFKKCPRKFEHL